MVVVVIVVVVVAVLVAGGSGSSCGRSGSRYTRRRILLSCSDAAPTIFVRSIRSDMGARNPSQISMQRTHAQTSMRFPAST